MVTQRVVVKRAHVAEHELESFVRGELGCAERRRVVLHLLAGCRECRAIGLALLALADHSLIPGPMFRGKPKRRGAR